MEAFFDLTEAATTDFNRIAGRISRGRGEFFNTKQRIINGTNW